MRDIDLNNFCGQKGGKEMCVYIYILCVIYLNRII